MAPTTRRNGANTSTPQNASMKETVDTIPSVASTISFEERPIPPIPSSYILLIYPFILALGSLFSNLSPVASPSHYTEPLGMASGLNTPTNHRPPPINYFASKHNLLNLYFVKIDWFWTTLAFVLLVFTTHATQPAKRPSSLNKTLQATLRWTIVTATWILTTQWFFGPPLIDRSFRLTGGRCEALPAKLNTSKADVSTIMTGLACKAVGGRWKGGHDISGHVFMLVLSSAFLVMELYISDNQSPHPHVDSRAAANIAHEMTKEEREAIGGWESESQAKLRLWTRYFVWTVAVLDVWMLLMTAIWFHTWLEKLSGLAISGLCIWTVYFLPAFEPRWRDIVGPA